MAAFYTEDAEVMAPDSEVVRGRDAIEAFFKAASAAAQRTGMRRTIQVRRVERSGDLGYLLSTVVLELPPADGQATIGFNDVTVWRRDAEQGWRIVVDSANREPAG
jgi:ketosteroid isomerase-like protein